MNEPTQPAESALTPREKQILYLIAQGMGTKQIADKLIISENTVANHRKNMLSKTGARSSAELIYLIKNIAN